MLDITIVLDRSGSMSSIREDAVGGVNAFIAAQQATPNSRLTLVLFDHEQIKLYDNVPIAHVTPLTAQTYTPRGNTALFDAIRQAIDDANKRLATDDTAVLVIVTDGHENASRMATIYRDGVSLSPRQQVFEAISNWRSLGREVTFLSATEDAMQTGVDMGVPMAATMAFHAGGIGTHAMFSSAARAVSDYGLTRSVVSYTVSERVMAMVPDAPDPNDVAVITGQVPTTDGK